MTAAGGQNAEGETWLVGDIEWVANQRFRVWTGEIGHGHRRETAADRPAKLRPVGWRGPAGLAGAHAAERVRARCLRWQQCRASQ